MDPCSGEKKANHDGVVHQHQLALARYVKVPAYNKLLLDFVLWYLLYLRQLPLS